MRILFISDPLFVESEIYNEEGYANLPMLQAMPCELDVATTAEQARQHIKDADIVLLESMRGVSFRDELNFINDHDVFVGAFYCDVWRGPLWYQSPINIDLNICVYREVALKCHAHFKEGENFLWLPPRVKTVPYVEGRDVDIVTWGALGREYPFRNYTFQALLQALEGGPRRDAHPVRVEPGLVANAVKVKNQKYVWHNLASKRMVGPFYGSKLMDELSRCKLCPTGPVVLHGVGSVVARFFENAAAGVVSIAPLMEDAGGLGFKQMENICFATGENFHDSLDLLLFKRDDLRRKISRNAHRLIMKRHTVSARAEELYDVLVDKTGGI